MRNSKDRPKIAYMLPKAKRLEYMFGTSKGKEDNSQKEKKANVCYCRAIEKQWNT